MDSKPPPPAATSKLRLMCSYGGRILPRQFDKTLFYAGGETRIVALDRRTTAASLSALTSHLSPAIFNNYSFLLKYQLPNEDLDSLISVVTDEDLLNMIEEHDRITGPARIRLFLFPAKTEFLASTLHDPKSESWFCDALKRTAISPKEQSAECGLSMNSQMKSGDSGGEDRHGAESIVLETNLSFGSSSSSISMSNSPPIEIVQCEDNRLNLLERKIRVPSSASIESVNSVGIATPSSKIELCQEPLIQVAPEAPSFLIDSGISISDPWVDMPSSKTVEVVGFQSSPQPDRKQLLQETRYIGGGGFHYNTPQYSANPMPVPMQMPISLFHPVYQMPVQQTIPCPKNQLYPVYLLPIRPAQYHTIPMQCDAIESCTMGGPCSRPQAAVASSSIMDKDVFGYHVLVEPSTKSYGTIVADTPSCQDQLVMPPPPISYVASAATAKWGGEFDEDIAYNPIYKTQPPPPSPSAQYQMVIKGTTLLSESTVQQPDYAKQPAAHSQQ